MFDENTTLEEILRTEHGKKVLRKHKVPCLSCPMAEKEINLLTIGEVADTYGLPKKKIIEELNKKNKN